MRAAWSIAPSHPGEPPFDTVNLASVLAAGSATHCAPTVLTADIDDENVWRGACLGCGWIATQLADDENPAIEEALDHTHPGWRHLPTLRRSAQSTSTGLAELRRLAQALYPTGWAHTAGPTWTARPRFATRHVPGRGVFAGYDLGRHDPALDAVSNRKQQTGLVTPNRLF